MTESDPRREMVAHCNDDILALMREAEAAGFPLEQVAILVLDRRDAAGGKVADVCAELGQPLEDADVCVAGFSLEGAREILGSVDQDLASRLHPEPPKGTAQLLCLAAGGVLSMFVGIPSPTP